MTRDDIIRMAREADFAEGLSDNLGGEVLVWGAKTKHLERFAALVAAAERTRACRIVTGLCISDNNAREICEAIRAEEPKDENPSFG